MLCSLKYSLHTYMWTFRAARVIGSRCCRALARPLSSSTQQNPTPVDLDYAAYIPPSGNKTDRALVFLHGLFGSKRVWTSLAKSFLQELDIPIYALDLRNQGDSPHVKPMTYSHMATDVLHFIHKHSLSNITLLGHSMYVCRSLNIQQRNNENQGRQSSDVYCSSPFSRRPFQRTSLVESHSCRYITNPSSAFTRVQRVYRGYAKN